MSGGGHNLSISARLSASAKSFIALGLIVLISYLASRLTGRQMVDNGLFALGFLIIAGITGGHFAALLGLPRLTGYLATGLLAGPSMFGVINDLQVSQLRLVNGLALALIALHAGCEFTTEMLQKNMRSLLWCTASHILIIVPGIAAAFYFLMPSMNLGVDLTLPAAIAVALMYGGIAVSKSPAVVVAVLGETKAKGPVSDHALGMVVVLDVVVLVLFALGLGLAQSTLDPGATFSLRSLADLLREILSSVAAGTFFGLFLIGYFWLINRERILFLVATGFGVTALCSYLHYDTLLVFVVAGFIVTNFSRQTQKMIDSIESLSSITMIVFFATAGASLHLNELLAVWPVVLAIAFSRGVLTFASEWLGHALAGSPPVLKKYGFTPFISQAGLTIGLAMIIYEKLPVVGPAIATLAISVVTVNEILGPIFMKWGLSRAGE